MTIEDIKRLPTTYEPTSASHSKASEVAGKEAGSQHTKSVAETGNNQPVSITKEPIASQQPVVDVNAAIDKLQAHVKSLDRELQFAVDDDTGRTVVTILDSTTQKILRQIPSEEILELSKSLDNAQGLLFNKEA